jgi:hypothetical protein
MRFLMIVLLVEEADASLPAAAPVVIVSPHPDDETLGCRGIYRCPMLAGDFCLR